MLKKSVLYFFSHGLAGVNPSKPHKLLNFFYLAMWQSFPHHGDCIAGCGLKQPANLFREFALKGLFALKGAFLDLVPGKDHIARFGKIAHPLCRGKGLFIV